MSLNMCTQAACIKFWCMHAYACVRVLERDREREREIERRERESERDGRREERERKRGMGAWGEEECGGK